MHSLANVASIIDGSESTDRNTPVAHVDAVPARVVPTLASTDVVWEVLQTEEAALAGDAADGWWYAGCAGSADEDFACSLRCHVGFFDLC